MRKRKRKHRSEIPTTETVSFVIFANTEASRLASIPEILDSHGNRRAAHLYFDQSYTRQQIAQLMSAYRKARPDIQWKASSGYTEAELEAFQAEQARGGTPVFSDTTRYRREP